MFSSKRTIATALITLTALGSGTAIASAGAGASVPTYSTTSRTETLVSPSCYHEHQVTTTYYRWNTKDGHYIKLVAPRRTVTDSTTCHK